jgi:CDP-4-dehydro-6-deoxyglucose reductase, E1
MEKIYYSLADYGKSEIAKVNKVLKENSLTLMNGKNVKIFENKVAKLFGKKYGVMVNSGSSANLLALASLELKKGSEVITPILTFSTTVSPILQLNLVPVFADVNKNKFLIDLENIENLITKKTKVIMVPNLLGNIADWKKLKKIGRKYNIILLEDSADTIGYKIDKKINGKLSDIVTSSFYASHIITAAGFGGIACFNDKKLFETAKIMRGWGRKSAITDEKESYKVRFNNKINNLTYDSKYFFTKNGYNFLPSEISAAFGLEQLSKLNNRLKKRKKNFKYLNGYLKKNHSDYFHLPTQQENTDSAWLAFPILLKSNKKNLRNMFQKFLEKKNIQTRAIFSGNVAKQPFMKNERFKLKNGISSNANLIMKNGILIGCHQLLKINELKYICNSISLFVNNNSK